MASNGNMDIFLSFQNLGDYVERVKEKYWSDWEEEQFKDPPPKEEKKKDEADGAKDKKEEDKGGTMH